MPTAQEILTRLTAHLPTPTRNADAFQAGDPATPITGIATTFVPSLDVLRKAAAHHRNLIIARESPYWARNPRQLAGNPLLEIKQKFIAENNLVIYRLKDAWDARTPSLQQTGLAKALGWHNLTPTGPYYQLASATTAQTLAARLKLNGVRILGAPTAKIKKAALTTGMITTPALAKILNDDPTVDAVIIGEPVEWEASTYFQDVLAAGQNKALIVLGLAASEEPGVNEMANWLKAIITEIPTELIPAGEPFAARKWS